MKQTIFKGEVVEVASGDDLVVLVDLGVEGLYKRTRVRLKGVDVPDAYKAKEGSEAHIVRNDVASMVSGVKVTLEVTRQGSAKSGWLAYVFVGDSVDGVCLNEVLRDKGYVFAG